MRTHKLCVTGYDWDGPIGTIRDKSGKPIYNIDVDKLTRGGILDMSSNILAVDKINLKTKKYIAEGVSQNDRRGDVYLFDIEFSVNIDSKDETVARVRLNDKQARELVALLDDRYKNI
jgi:hypothetical protein